MIPPRFRHVLDSTSPVAEPLRAKGHRVYLVGGLVRDLLVDRAWDGQDIDLTSDARPEQIKAAIAPIADALWTQGERFGTIGCRVDGVEFEITTHRAESYDPGSRKPTVTFSDAIEADLSRRDFTVNALAVEIGDGADATLIDPFDGATDLAAKRLRTPLSPEESFTDDPLRMLRAARFIAGYDLGPDPELVEAVRSLRGRMSIVSGERIRDELDKLLVVPDPRPGLWFLVDTGLMDEFFPEISTMRLEQDPIHQHKDVLAHTFAVINNVSHLDAAGKPNRITRLAALFHDIGKPRTREIGPNGVSFHHHEVVGARMTRERMRALRYSKADIEAVSRLVFLHLRFHTYAMGWTDAAVRRFVRDAGDLLDELIELTRCDCTTRNKRKAAELSRRMDLLEERIARLREEEELAAIRPDLDGSEVMELLGLEPGPQVGEAMRFLMDLRLEEGPLDAHEARQRLLGWWERRAES